MTREEAIKWLSDELMFLERPNVIKGSGLEKKIAVFRMAIDALREQEERRWIPVTEMSPEIGGYVVCIAKRNPFSRFMPMVARIEKNGWVNPITEQYISEVTHWMPLPELPKEG